mmetsp:Transcript_62564/g.129979  ORF Transcript_62564/g.129979 Transcript_62564/m.129979 type:complete len:364 (-) Transcript_62564:774-1865(-)
MRKRKLQRLPLAHPPAPEPFLALPDRELGCQPMRDAAPHHLLLSERERHFKRAVRRLRLDGDALGKLHLSLGEQRKRDEALVVQDRRGDGREHPRHWVWLQLHGRVNIRAAVAEESFDEPAGGGGGGICWRMGLGEVPSGGGVCERGLESLLELCQHLGSDLRRTSRHEHGRALACSGYPLNQMVADIRANTERKDAHCPRGALASEEVEHFIFVGDLPVGENKHLALPAGRLAPEDALQRIEDLCSSKVGLHRAHVLGRCSEGAVVVFARGSEECVDPRAEADNVERARGRQRSEEELQRLPSFVHLCLSRGGDGAHRSTPVDDEDDLAGNILEFDLWEESDKPSHTSILVDLQASARLVWI